MTLSQIENAIALQQRRCEKQKRQDELYRQLVHLRNQIVKREIND